ncbi:GGDEF domain-containing protein [Actinoplanes palleronii]|uniref:GGDEF domain-containing protein n=1 Tax=Actinoplanes palleronii TaxID=113570 RepID=UPI001EF1EED8|nr:GGDEF domain-containing protein [Actinoplanes palleronii]
MRETTQHAVRLLERAQTGDAIAALAEAEAVLRSVTGDLADGPACMHFVRVVAHIAQGEPLAAIAAAEPMLRAARREGSAGWQACALASRAWQRLRLGETDTAEHDVAGVLRDLVAAGILAAGEPDPVAAVNSRVAIAIGWYELRLYELVVPQFRSAYEMSFADGEQNGNRAMWLLNLTETHLRWALELYQINRVAEAESHTAEAERYATQAAREVSGDDAGSWRDNALLYAACARADRHDPAGAAVDIAFYAARLAERGAAPDALATSRIFHGVALLRSGRPDEAIEVMTRAVADLRPDTDWLVVAGTHRTQAVLLAHLGSSDARTTLAYGDGLATALWRQRLNTLHAARALYDLELLRVQHDQVARAAELDPLTGIANRRALDRAVELAGNTSGADRQRYAVLVIDTDKFKMINDSQGHAAGDVALRAIAAALAAQGGAQDLVARLGGDEFAALLPGADEDAAAVVASRMVLAVRAIPDCIATVSIGVAVGVAADLSDAVLRADAAMYRVKRRGGDGVEWDDPGVTALAA